MRIPRWIIPLPAILFSFFPSVARAEPTAGLNAVGYIVTEVPPTRSDTIYETCGSELENNINRNFNGEPFQQCPVDYFMIHYSGFITVPENNTIQFMIAADDGGTIQIGDTEFGTWDDKGCSWSEQTTNEFPANTYALNGWLYENGGETCFMLAWNINDAGWEIVPDEAFTTTGAPTTTTTTTTTTTSTTTTTTTTTTLPEPTTTTSSTTTLPPTTTTTTSTTVPQTTTSTTTTSTSTTTTTEVPYTPPQTTTTTTVPEPATTTTTSVPETSTTLQETSTTVPDEIVPETTVLDVSVPFESVPDESKPTTTLATTTSTTIQTESTEKQTEEASTQDTSSETNNKADLKAFVEDLHIKSSEPIDDKKVTQILNFLETATPSQIVATIGTLLTTELTNDQAVEILSSSAVLESIDEDQAEQLFQTVVVDELSVEQANNLIEVIQQAPRKIKFIFEEVVNIFGSKFESYVPDGSTIPVSQRRVLLAVSALLSSVPVMPSTSGRSSKT